MQISVLIATHNRAEYLHRTLSSLVRLDCSGLSVSFIVIDNNSADRTRQVVEAAGAGNPFVYLFEERQGKNHALNRAIDSIDLGEVVVFTDDDVRPAANWLQTIAGACAAHEKYSVFGGAVIPLFEISKAPRWTSDAFIRSHVYTHHVFGDGRTVVAYTGGSYPIGPNLWMRRKVFDHGYRFNPAIGPRPHGRIMGSETSFLHGLRQDGYAMLHVPSALVEHWIKPDEITLAHVRRRLRLRGRSAPLATELRHRHFFEKHPWAWRVFRMISMARWCCLGATAWIPMRRGSFVGRLGRAYMRMHMDWSELRVSSLIVNCLSK